MPRKTIEKVTIAKEVANVNVQVPDVDIDLTEDHIDKKTIEKIIFPYKPNNLALYQRAFVHVSIKTIVNKSDKRFVKPYLKEPNERLEFLGDSI